MPVMFYPHEEDMAVGNLKERLDILMEAAERYKAVVIDAGSTLILNHTENKRITPRDIKVAFNWQEISKILREIRELPESNQSAKAAKADRLFRLAEIYEVLRGAKMPKLEAVRLALLNEVKQLRT